MTYENPGDKNYNAFLHWCVTSQCNFDCKYCFGKIPVNRKELRKIQIDKLLSTLSKTNKIFRMGFTGGEPFLIPNFIEACKAISKEHYISINSNIVLPAVKEFAESIDPERVLFVQASFHPVELNDKKLFENYVENFNKLKQNGFNVVSETVVYPVYKKLIEENSKLLKERGIELLSAPYIGKLDTKDYPAAYSENEIDLFNLERERIKYHYQKGENCNAGFTAGVVYSNGDVYPCFQIKNKIGNIYSQINFENKIGKCPAKFCGCPLNKYDPSLFSLSTF